jgi:DeoR/GlpR family transcriptional regulator of sugar metabolism
VLDSGTTAVEIAAAMGDVPLRVVPLSLPAAHELAAHQRVALTLPGGEVRSGEGSFIGPAAEQTLRSLRFDSAVISPCGLSLRDAVTAYDPADAAMKRAAMNSAARRILICDESKWDTTAFAAFADLADFELVVTDHRPTPAEAAYFHDRDIEVVVV